MAKNYLSITSVNLIENSYYLPSETANMKLQ
jgi:hypothetical protein